METQLKKLSKDELVYLISTIRKNTIQEIEVNYKREYGEDWKSSMWKYNAVLKRLRSTYGWEIETCLYNDPKGNSCKTVFVNNFQGNELPYRCYWCQGSFCKNHLVQIGRYAYSCLECHIKHEEKFL